ncbi:MAG: hypothetical protein U0Y10_05815 [Spirosomataceae bacterium]
MEKLSLVESVALLNQLIEAGQTLLAMERFYAENVTMQENEEPPRYGKQLCIEHEQQNLSYVKALKCTLLNQAINPETGVVFSEWEYWFTNHKDKTSGLREVSVQQWQNGQIVREKFYYQQLLSA